MVCKKDKVILYAWLYIEHPIRSNKRIKTNISTTNCVWTALFKYSSGDSEEEDDQESNEDEEEQNWQYEKNWDKDKYDIEDLTNR